MRKIFFILLASIGLAGCSSPKLTALETNQKRIKELNARIEKTVTDPVRAQAMKEVIDDLDRQLQSHGASLERKRDAIVEASADYATTRQDMEVLYAGVDSEMRELLGRLKEAYAELTAQATPEEWAVIARGKKRIFGFN